MDEHQQFRVAILTPYLTGEVMEKCVGNGEKLQQQREKYGAQDLRGVLGQFEEHEPGIYLRRSPLETVLDLCCRDQNIGDMLQKADLAVVGCTEEVERDVWFSKKAGFLFARCSIFYGKPSGYSGWTPEEAGYAFDLSKDKEKVLSFLMDEKMGRAILERDLKKIEGSLGEFNGRSGLSEPV